MKRNENLNKVMETESISKDGVGLKNLMSRKNLMKKIFLFSIVFCVSEGVWGQETVYWESIKRNATNGDIKAQLYVGMIYALGSDDFFKDNSEYKLDTKISENLEQAVYWFRKAAEQGEVNSQFFLGKSYYEGDGVTQDYTQAVYWFRKAAEQGNTDAQFHLGLCYDNGYGIEKDGNTALYWYEKRKATNKDLKLDDVVVESRIEALKSEGYSSSRANISASTSPTPTPSKTQSSTPSQVTSTQNSQRPTAQIEEVRQEHNITKDGNVGMEIHVKFHVQGMLGKQGKIAVFFCDENKNYLTLRTSESNSSYRSPNGTLTVQNTFTPGYERAIYEDFILFMPYHEFRVIYQTGKHWMKFYVAILYEKEEIVDTDYYEFNWEL